MTLLGSLFRPEEKATTLTLRDDIITSDRILGDLSSLWGMWGSIPLDTDYTQTYEQIAQKQLWVRVAVNKLAYSMGRLPLKAYRIVGDGRERVTDGGLPNLLRRPNETKETGHMPGFIARIIYDLMVYGNALIVKGQTRPDRPVEWLQPFTPVGWRIEDDKYIYRNPTTGLESTPIPAWRVIHIVEPGPTNTGFGVSRLEAARLTLAIEYMAQKLGESTFRNGAMPGSIINVKGGLPTEQKARADSVERFKSEVVRRLGGVSKAGLPAVLEGEIDWKSIAHNLDDSAVVAHRQLTREEVAALLDIPQPAMGILDEANFASVDILHVMLYQDSMGWPVRLTESALNTQLVRDVAEYDGQFVEFDMNAVMRGDIESRYRAYATAITTGFKTPNEIRALENDAPIQQDGADMLLFPMNLSGAVGAQVAEDTTL